MILILKPRLVETQQNELICSSLNKKLHRLDLSTPINTRYMDLIIGSIKLNKASFEKKAFNTETKLHFAYTSKNMTDNTSGKN